MSFIIVLITSHILAFMAGHAWTIIRSETRRTGEIIAKEMPYLDHPVVKSMNEREAEAHQMALEARADEHAEVLIRASEAGFTVFDDEMRSALALQSLKEE